MISGAAYLTTSAVAAQLGVSVEQVLGWVHSGELRAVNVATKRGGRPRWRIGPEEVDRFIAARTMVPAEKTTRKRGRLPNVIEFF